MFYIYDLQTNEWFHKNQPYPGTLPWVTTVHLEKSMRFKTKEEALRQIEILNEDNDPRDGYVVMEIHTP